MDLENLKRLATTIRILSAEAVEHANSGHPGMPMGTADIAAVLWSYHLRFNPRSPDWLGRDRFVLSAGHGSMLLYSMLHLFGYDLPLDQIKSFRQLGSKTPGHPEFGLTPGVETTTGPLGQGFANGVGLALSGSKLAQHYSRDLFSYRVFGIVSDGDLMEGVASEAASLAGHLGLGNIVYIYDDNHISIGGDTDVCFSENVPHRFESYGWHVETVDGHDLSALNDVLNRGVRVIDQPTLICARTTIAQGSPNKANTADAHGAPLGAEELEKTKRALAWAHAEEFYLPEEVLKFCSDRVKSKLVEYQEWHTRFDLWAEQNTALASALTEQRDRKLPAVLKQELVDEYASQEEKVATRALSGKVIQTLAKHLPNLIGGSADLEPSNKTMILNSSDIARKEYGGANVRFGVREHAMGSIINGLAYERLWYPYTGTFLVFSDYMRPALRLAALSHLQSLFIFTHDSFWVGEDGPTHQPIEHIMSLRLIPNLHVYRPADSLEVALCYLSALEYSSGPSALLFTRQGVEPLRRDTDFAVDQVLRGGYVVCCADRPDVVLVATGSEVALAQSCVPLLTQLGIQASVVSLPCWEVFLQQDQVYQDCVLPPGVKRVSIEAGTTLGWEDLLGTNTLSIGIDHFGTSAPGADLAIEFGFTPEIITKKVTAWFQRKL